VIPGNWMEAYHGETASPPIRENGLTNCACRLTIFHLARSLRLFDWLGVGGGRRPWLTNPNVTSTPNGSWIHQRDHPTKPLSVKGRICEGTFDVSSMSKMEVKPIFLSVGRRVDV